MTVEPPPYADPIPPPTDSPEPPLAPEPPPAPQPPPTPAPPLTAGPTLAVPEPAPAPATTTAAPVSSAVPARRPVWLWALTAVLLVLAVVATGLWLGERRQASDLAGRRDEALAAARRLATNLTTYDYRRIAEDVKRVSDNATGKFAKDYALAGGGQFQQIVKDNKAVAKGDVKSAGIVALSGTRAVVLLAVDQSVTNSNTPAGRVDRNRIQLTLVLRAGKWLVEDVVVV